MRLLFESSDERACPLQGGVVIIDQEKQEEAVARLRVVGTHQRRMLMGTPLVKAQQDRSIRVEDLTEVVMGGSRVRLAKQRLVPVQTSSHVAYPDDGPCALHGASCAA